MNAFEQVKSLAMISKVEAIVYSFRSQFPECIADLKPWVRNDETKYFSDPNSIDIGFHFPNANFSCRCRSILMQVKIRLNSEQQDYKAVGKGFHCPENRQRWCPDRSLCGVRRIGPGPARHLEKLL